MKLRRFFLLVVLMPLLLVGCGGKDPEGGELPPPSGKDQPTDAPGGDDIDGGSGKEATPLGKDWTSVQIDEGVVYHTFSGVDEITEKYQEVFVIDVDLNNPKYQVKLVYESPRLATSAAFKKRSNAIAAINANYEPKSIYMRVDGKVIYPLENEYISDTGVPNWKSEAAFSISGDSNVSFLWAGSQKKGEVTVAQQKLYYTGLSTETCPNIISSAPMLIYNFNSDYGEKFVDYNKSTTNLSGEDPDKHQRTLHPRTAIALTEKNHLILFCVDGRIKSQGMGARSLTRFLKKWFNPKYALNLDGGGSTTMCVKGQGDNSTHVVNYPCDGNKNYDHTGERTRDAFIMILKK
jgi:exopolysaccharide biosynthesis protein